MSCNCMYCYYLSYFIRFLFFTVSPLYVNVRMNMYVMFLLRQQRLNKLIIIISHYRLLNMYEHWEGLIVQINGGKKKHNDRKHIQTSTNRFTRTNGTLIDNFFCKRSQSMLESTAGILIKTLIINRILCL